MRIVGPHFHIWDLEKLSYPWLITAPSLGVFGDNSAIRKTYTLSDFMGRSGRFEIAKAVHIEAAVAEGKALHETLF